MKKTTFTQSLYVGAPNSADVRKESSYQTWLRVTTEKVLLQFWLQDHLPTFVLSKQTNHEVHVLDLGCGFGHMSGRLIHVLLSMGLRINYTGVDPYPAQLDQFQRSAIASPNLTLRLLKGDASSHVPDRDYDLVFASHMLYYVENWSDVLTRIVGAGNEIIIVHHGHRGINTIHEHFRDHIHPGPHIISTDDQVTDALRLLPLNGRQVVHRRFPSTVAVRACQLPGSRAGNNLISFFLETPFKEIDPLVVQNIRTFMRDLYAPDHLMVHDVGVITIRP
ncbi:MAG TPA: class I SAM-dependent methyltransferase [Patescibacteria group bacterium]|nr:class I SAM-dependent methyltransferase [Patescibacteria group bacterium]